MIDADRGAQTGALFPLGGGVFHHYFKKRGFCHEFYVIRLGLIIGAGPAVKFGSLDQVGMRSSPSIRGDTVADNEDVGH